MTDLGFGLLDRRTVIVALLTIVIVNVLFQFNLPIRSSNASELFIDLVLFTGYLYLARSLVRLPFSIIGALFFIPSEHIHNFAWSQHINEMLEKKNANKLKVIISKIIYVLGYSIKTIFYTIIGIPLSIIYSSDFESRVVMLERSSESYTDMKNTASVIRFIDRAGLIAMVTLSTLPNYTAVTKKAGAVGIIIMILIYLFKGDFTFFIKDKITDKEKESESESESL